MFEAATTVVNIYVVVAAAAAIVTGEILPQTGNTKIVSMDFAIFSNMGHSILNGKIWKTFRINMKKLTKLKYGHFFELKLRTNIFEDHKS